MKFHNHKLKTGVAIPVSSLTGEKSCGCGEFADLSSLAPWCVKTGLNIIQILPINDTGTNPSPYSSLSAMALNPAYIRIDLIEGSEFVLEQVEKFRKDHQSFDHIRYIDTYIFKMNVLRQIFDKHISRIMVNRKLRDWILQNGWVKPYAAFKILSEMNQTIVWKNWRHDPVFNENSEIKKNRLHYFLNINEEKYFFQAWVQFELEKQLIHVCKDFDKKGLNLKGDLPILMDKESCDVWYDREYFNLGRQAGAPPDDFSQNGQNWGFPVYNIKAMVDDGFSWWKNRIARFNKFFHAIRLDHVIGFMRIWQIPAGETHANLGFFSPAAYIHRNQLIETGITEHEIDKLCSPLVDDQFLESCADQGTIDYLKNKYLVPFQNPAPNAGSSSTENQSSTDKRVYYTFSNSVLLEKNEVNENSILALNESDHIIEILGKIHRNRVLLKISPGDIFENKMNDKEIGEFAPAWSYKNSVFYLNMSDDKKNNLNTLVENYLRASEEIWYVHGKMFLSEILSASNGIFCGEDLGAVPSVTGKMLKDLDIFSLKVLRWTRNYAEPPAEFYPPGSYPPLSVATTSVHDSENIRQWWKNDAGAREQLFPLIIHFMINSLLGVEKNQDSTLQSRQQSSGLENIPGELSAELATSLLIWFFHTSSKIVILPIQDYFAVDDRYRIEDPSLERINIPGKVLDTNWTYKLPCTPESLAGDDIFINKIKALVDLRNRK